MCPLVIIIFINCNWVITRWQWLFYMNTNMEKKVTRKFKSGGLHERHAVAINFTESIPLCDIISIYIFTSYTTM